MDGHDTVLVGGNARARTLASAILGAAEDEVIEAGVGETFVCWAASDRAVLLSRVATDAAAATLDVVASCSATARALGVRTPRVISVGCDPWPHALLERVWARPTIGGLQHRPEFYESVGRELAVLARAEVRGAGNVVVSRGVLRGQANDWRAHCEDFTARFVLDAGGEAVGIVRSLGDLDDGHWRALADRISDHGRRDARLCHYDNRIPNLPIDDTGVWILDWNLARVAPVSHELIKLYERPADEARVAATALLDGYGVPAGRHDDVIADALTALAMDGLAMSIEWAPEPLFHGGIKAWLTTIRRVITNTIS